MKRYWFVFIAVQAVGILCSLGNESFAATRAGIASRVVAFIVLQPGVLLMRVAVEMFSREYLSPEQLAWYAALTAPFANAIFAAWAYYFVRALKPNRLTS